MNISSAIKNFDSIGFDLIRFDWIRFDFIWDGTNEPSKWLKLAIQAVLGSDGDWHGFTLYKANYFWKLIDIIQQGHSFVIKTN